MTVHVFLLGVLLFTLFLTVFLVSLDCGIGGVLWSGATIASCLLSCLLALSLLLLVALALLLLDQVVHGDYLLP